MLDLLKARSSLLYTTPGIRIFLVRSCHKALKWLEKSSTYQALFFDSPKACNGGDRAFPKCAYGDAINTVYDTVYEHIPHPAFLE